MEKDIYKMELHECMEVRCGVLEYYIVRVAGGWLYNCIKLDSQTMTCTFVPYDNGFQIALRK